MFVTKFDGRKQPFQKQKVVRTCLRMGASREQARKIANRIEREAYDGIRTKKILDMIFKYIKEYRPETKHQIDLREAISLLRPKPDFESFIRLILKESGYRVWPNRILEGGCVEHEVDAIAEKNNKIFYVEVKHHFNHHVYTGVNVCLEVQSRFEDLVEGFRSGKNDINFTKPMIVCNTKFSDHAKKYLRCKNMMYIGWRAPEERGLERMVEGRKLYPITFLKGLDKKTEEKLGNAGIVLLKQLVETDIARLRRRTKVSKKELELLVKKAKEILS